MSLPFFRNPIHLFG